MDLQIFVWNIIRETRTLTSGFKLVFTYLTLQTEFHMYENIWKEHSFYLKSLKD